MGHFTMLGLDFDLEADGEPVADVLAHLWEPFRRAGRGEHQLLLRSFGVSTIVTWDEAVVLRPEGPQECLAMSIWWINQRTVQAPVDAVLVHAGVASLDGGALVFPGASGSGKSTLVAGLVRAGLGYLSDEIAVIARGSGLVSPFPRALTLEADVWAAFPELSQGPILTRSADQWFVSPGELRDGATGRRALPIKAVIFPTARPGTSTVSRPVSRADALIRLGRHCFNMSAVGSSGFHALAGVVARTEHIFELESATVQSAVEEVLHVVRP